MYFILFTTFTLMQILNNACLNDNFLHTAIADHRVSNRMQVDLILDISYRDTNPITIKDAIWYPRGIIRFFRICLSVCYNFYYVFQ